MKTKKESHKVGVSISFSPEVLKLLDSHIDNIFIGDEEPKRFRSHVVNAAVRYFLRGAKHSVKSK